MKVDVEKRSDGLEKLIKKKIAVKQSKPTFIKPMPAALFDKAFDSHDWIYEVNWDGYRSIAVASGNNATLYSRDGKNISKEFQGIIKAIKSLKRDVILDGEIVVFDQNGKPDLNALQNRKSLPADSLTFVVFDLLWIDGYSLLNAPLIERKTLLCELLSDIDSYDIKYCEHFQDSGITLFEEVVKLGLEGIVAKKCDSKYCPGKPSDHIWRKIKNEKHQEFVIAGFTNSERTGIPFKDLLIGFYEEDKLVYLGNCELGFKQKDYKELFAKFKKLETDKSPFINPVESAQEIHWLKPELVADFKISGQTPSGRIRDKAVYMGMRTDKEAIDVVREIVFLPKDADEILNKKEQPAKKLKPMPGSNWVKVFSEKVTSSHDLEIENETLILTNLSKPIWEIGEPVTKFHLIEYYLKTAEYILPYLKDRPLSLYMKQQKGIYKEGFYIKDMEGFQPSYMDVFPVKRPEKTKGKRNVIEYAMANNKASLLHLINIGCIDLNPWLSTCSNPLQPGFAVINLDSSGKNFDDVIEVALACADILKGLKVKSWVKTSGKTGMHIVIPVSNGESFSVTEKFCAEIAVRLYKKMPNKVTLEREQDKRADKVYPDWTQNKHYHTIATPYAVRPYHLPTVSTPLYWREVKKGMRPTDYTIFTIPERLKKHGDIFKDILKPTKTNLSDVLQKLV